MKAYEDPTEFRGDCLARSRALEERWAGLRARYLAVAVPDSIWRYSRRGEAGDPEQGWKLHLSATILSACDLLAAVGPQMCRRRVLFKAPASLHDLDRLNSGIHYGYSQVGKFITVYPKTDDEAVALARLLHRLTRGVAEVSVPFDLKYRPDSCVHYRYGSFQPIEMERPDGSRVMAMRDPHGRLVPDDREGPAFPDWVTDPFASRRALGGVEAPETPLKTTFKAFRALTQRGKGGVYLAVDLSAASPRLCVLKEGRRDGETNWAGRDGYWRVAHEARVLAALGAAGVRVPLVYASFQAEKNFYLAMEFVEGESLQTILKRRRRRLPLQAALALGLRLAELVARIHATGWTWRDCKPGNLIVGADGNLRALDFEGACPVDEPDLLPWGTPSFVPPEWYDAPCIRPRLPEDLYALGAILYLLLAGRAPSLVTPTPLARVRRGIPPELRDLVAQLLHANPARRPAAASVVQRLGRILREGRGPILPRDSAERSRGRRARDVGAAGAHAAGAAVRDGG